MTADPATNTRAHSAALATAKKAPQLHVPTAP